MDREPIRSEFEEVMHRVGAWADGFGKRRLAFIGLGAIVVLWILSGVYTVGASERGVVTTFGKVASVEEPGLHYHLPWPIQQAHVVDVATVRRAEIGFRTGNPVLAEALMLTGDENIVHVELFVQYVVTDPVDFLFRVRDPEVVLRNAAEAALRSEVGQRPIEFTQTEGRLEVQDAVRARLQTLLDAYRSGITVTEARLLTVDPPQEVQDAFLEVVRAFEDRDRLVQEAQAYAARVVPEARGEAAQMLQQAEGYKERRTLNAQGDAARFLLVLTEYRLAPEVTRERLYLESIERAMNHTNKIILDTANGNVLPLLPLTGGAPVAPVAALATEEED